MEIVLLTAIGVGASTIIGSIIGFIFKNSDIFFIFIINDFMNIIIIH